MAPKQAQCTPLQLRRIAPILTVLDDTQVIPRASAIRGGDRTMTMTTIAATIETLTKELRVRESAASHLRGIPARQNQSSIASLYDRLNYLHIASIEAKEAK